MKTFPLAVAEENGGRVWGAVAGAEDERKGYEKSEGRVQKADW